MRVVECCQSWGTAKNGKRDLTPSPINYQLTNLSALMMNSESEPWARVTKQVHVHRIVKSISVTAGKARKEHWWKNADGVSQRGIYFTTKSTFRPAGFFSTTACCTLKLSNYKPDSATLNLTLHLDPTPSH